MVVALDPPNQPQRSPTSLSPQDGISALEQQSSDLGEDERSLEGRLRKKQAELLRGQKRLESLTSVRPAFMDEYERLEGELAHGVWG